LGSAVVVDDQPGVVPANLSVGFMEQRRLQRRGVPGAAGDQVVQLVIVDACGPRRHRLNTLAIARANQPSNMGRTQPCARLVPQRRNKRRKPTLKIDSPIPVHGGPPKADLPCITEDASCEPSKCARLQKSAKDL